MASKHQNLPLLFSEAATLKDGVYHRDPEIERLRKNYLYKYLLNVTLILKHIGQGGLVLGRFAGTPTPNTPRGPYVSGHTELTKKNRLKYVLDTSLPIAELQSSILTFINDYMFYDCKKMTDFNWFLVEAPSSYVEQEKVTPRPKKSVGDEDFQSAYKKHIFLDFDLKDQFASCGHALGFTDDKDSFIKNVNSTRSPYDKLAALTSSTLYQDILQTGPADIIYTGNGLHVVYFSQINKKWDLTRTRYFKHPYSAKKSKDVHAYAHFYLSQLAYKFISKGELDEACSNPARLRRLPFSYNYKPGVSPSVESAQLSTVLKSTFLNMQPEEIEAACQNKDPQLFGYVDGFLEKTTALEPTKKRGRPSKVESLEDIAVALAAGKTPKKEQLPFYVKDRLKEELKSDLFVRIKLYREKRGERGALHSTLTFGEVFRYFGFTDAQSNYSQTEQGDRTFSNAISPFRHRLGTKDTINVSEERDPSFRYNDNTGIWYDFGEIPTFKSGTNVGDVFALTYLLHLKKSGAQQFPEYLDKEALQTVESLVTNILKLDKLNIYTDSQFIGINPSKTDKNGRFTLMRQPQLAKCVMHNYLFGNYDVTFDTSISAFLYRRKGESGFNPFRRLDDPDCPLSDLAAAIPSRGGQGTIKPTSYFYVHTAANHTASIEDYVNIDKVCEGLADAANRLLSRNFYEEETLERKRPDGTTVIERYLIPKINSPEIPKSMYHKNVAKVPVISANKALLRFAGNEYFDVLTAKFYANNELPEDYKFYRTINMHTPFPNKPFEEYDAPLLRSLLNSVFKFDAESGSNKLVLQYFLANIFIAANPDSQAVVLRGDGGEGKTVFLEVVKRVLVEGVYTELKMRHLMAGTSDNNAATALFRIIGMWLLTVSDFESGYLPSALKELLTGDKDGGIAKALYANGITFTNIANVIILANSVPKIAREFIAFGRRFLVAEVPSRDAEAKNIPRLADKIVENEREAVVALLVDAIKLFKTFDFKFPDNPNNKDCFLPRAQEITTESIKSLALASDYADTTRLLYYAPGEMLDAEAYLAWCGKAEIGTRSKREADNMSVANATTFLGDALKLLSKYAKDFLPNQYDRKKLPNFFPKEEATPPVIFVSKSKKLKYLLNVSISTHPSFGRAAASAHSSFVRRLDTFFEKIVRDFSNIPQAKADIAAYEYSAARAAGEYTTSEKIAKTLFRLALAIKNKKENLPVLPETSASGATKKVLAPVRKLVRRPVNSTKPQTPHPERKKLASNDAKPHKLAARGFPTSLED